MFTPVLQAMARIGGVPEVRWATVAHPLGSAPRDVLRERAAQAIEQFERIVTGRAASG